MEKLSNTEGLVITQQKEFGEIVTGFETKNKYAVMNLSGQQVYMALEVGGSFLTRNFLKGLRPFEIHITAPDQKLVLKLKRSFRFYFHTMDIFDAGGQLLGTIRRDFSILRRRYTINDSSGHEVFRLFGPLLHPWTFNIIKDGLELGKITKKWSGLLKESYTDADNFGISYQQDLDITSKALLLGSVMLIDFIHFEGNNNK